MEENEEETTFAIKIIIIRKGGKKRNFLWASLNHG